MASRLTRQQLKEQLILGSSVERVINMTLEILEKSKSPDAPLNHDDWTDLKWVVVDLWNEERNRIHERNMRREP